MNLGRPIADVVPGPRGLLLATALQLERPATVRELARHSGVSPQAALLAVNDLADAGIMNSERAGRALMVAVNRDHILAGPLMELARARGRLIEKMADELAGWQGLAGAWVFGSTARGDGTRRSDVDLLLVADDSTDTAQWAEDTAALADHVLDWTGNHVQFVEHTRHTFAELVRGRNPLIAAVRREGIALTRRSRTLLRGWR